MAKKPSSKSKRAKKPAVKSSVKGGGIMSLNKSNTSPFMKGIIIVIIVAMVTLFFTGGIASFVELFKPEPKVSVPDAVAQLKNKYEPQLDNWNTVLASNPESYTVLVRLGTAHYDYAAELMELASKNSTSAAQVAAEQWAAAADALKQAVKAKKAEPGVFVDYAVATFYSGDTTAAVKIASKVVKKTPDFAPAYFNLGIFYEAMDSGALAVGAFQKYLALDPTGKTGNVAYVKERLASLGASATPIPGVAASSAPATP